MEQLMGTSGTSCPNFQPESKMDQMSYSALKVPLSPHGLLAAHKVWCEE